MVNIRSRNLVLLNMRKKKRARETYSAVLLLIRDLSDSAGELASLTDGGKSSAEAHSDQGAEEEATGIQTDNNVDLLVNGGVDVVDNVGDHHLDSNRILEQGEDILEQDTLLGKVGNIADKRVDALNVHG